MIRRPQKKPKTLPPVRPNVGIEQAYARRLLSLLDEMHRSVSYWILKEYKASPPKIAGDALPADALRKEFNGLAKRWRRRFDEAAPKMADYFADKTTTRTDDAMKTILKDAGWSVQFKNSAAVKDTYAALVTENVGLIRNLSSDYLSAIEGAVMRSVQTGRDLSTLGQELEDRIGITKRRARLIARDQSNKATAIQTRVRQQELGVTEAIWLHSHAGRHPRPEHVAFDGHKYNIQTGAYLEGVWTWPGVEINCRCVSRPIIPGFDED